MLKEDINEINQGNATFQKSLDIELIQSDKIRITLN
jgi:hypothetical protein